MKPRSRVASNNERSQRQLRVGEMLRRALADILSREPLRTLDLDGTRITVTEVQVSPDLKNATVFCTEFAGKNLSESIETLNKARKEIRGILGKRIDLRSTPEIQFRMDTSFERADAIGKLLRTDRIRNDLSGKENDSKPRQAGKTAEKPETT